MTQRQTTLTEPGGPPGNRQSPKRNWVTVSTRYFELASLEEKKRILTLVEKLRLGMMLDEKRDVYVFWR